MELGLTHAAPPDLRVERGRPGRGPRAADVAVVMDVLRMTTTAAVLMRRCSRVAVAATLDDLPQLEQPLSDLLLVSELADAESALFHLVNARQGKGRLTILTGNLNEADIYRVYGERTLARICHQGAIVPVKGRDMRRGAQQRSEGGS